MTTVQAEKYLYIPMSTFNPRTYLREHSTLGS